MSQQVPGYPFGTDLNCIMQSDGSIDLDPGMGEVSGRTLLVQRVMRRVTTPRGSVVDAPNDCVDLRNVLRAGVLASTPTNLQIQLQQELQKEQGVSSPQVGVKYVQQTSTLTITMSMQSSYGPLNMTFTITGSSAGSVNSSNISVILNGLPVNFSS
jgi:hypothetical protein